MKSHQITLTMIDDRNTESVSVHPNFRAAREHGDEMLDKAPSIGWVGWIATDGESEISRIISAV